MSSSEVRHVQGFHAYMEGHQSSYLILFGPRRLRFAARKVLVQPLTNGVLCFLTSCNLGSGNLARNALYSGVTGFNMSHLLFQAGPSVDHADLYFLILHLLAEGPCHQATEALRVEAAKHGLLPTRADVYGERLPFYATFWAIDVS